MVRIRRHGGVGVADDDESGDSEVDTAKASEVHEHILLNDEGVVGVGAAVGSEAHEHILLDDEGATPELGDAGGGDVSGASDGQLSAPSTG